MSRLPVAVLLAWGLFAGASGRADDVFTYSPGESQLIRQTFDTSADWLFDFTATANSWLVGQTGYDWMKATLWLARPVDPAEGELNFYWSFRTDSSVGEDPGAVYFRLNLTDTPGLIEQFNYTVQIRPGIYGGPPRHSGVWAVYADPGFNIPHTAQTNLRPSVGFVSTNQVENFRLRLLMPDTNHVELTPFWWDRSSSAWQQILAITGDSPMVVDLATQVTNNRVIRALELQFRQATPAVDAVAITQKLSTSPPLRITRLIPAATKSELEWSGGAAPWLVERSTNLLSEWTTVETNYSSTALLPGSTNDPMAFWRIRQSE
jgi:hypothetical protein